MFKFVGTCVYHYLQRIAQLHVSTLRMRWIAASLLKGAWDLVLLVKMATPSPIQRSTAKKFPVKQHLKLFSILNHTYDDDDDERVWAWFLSAHNITIASRINPEILCWPAKFLAHSIYRRTSVITVLEVTTSGKINVLKCLLYWTLRQKC